MLIHFSILCIVLLFNLLALVLTIKVSPIQIWPPPSNRSWQFWFTWVSFTYFMVGIPILGFLDYGSLVLSDLPRFLCAGILFLISFPIGMSAIYQLSFKQTLGLEGKFITSGVYRFSRNPQYVTHILLIGAVILVTNSILALIAGFLYSLWFILAPFSEEPWLNAQFGQKYSAYCEQVPRFLGRPKR